MPPIEKPRFVLLARPDAALLAPLMKLLLLDHVPSTQGLWNSGQWSAIKLQGVLY